MLKIDDFRMMMGLLKGTFVKWDADTGDRDFIGAWFSAFKGMDAKEFSDMVRCYCSTRTVPPFCPIDLLQPYLEVSTRSDKDAITAFWNVYDYLAANRYWFWDKAQAKAPEAVPRHFGPVVGKAFLYAEQEFRWITTDDENTLTMAKAKFIEGYQNARREYVFSCLGTKTVAAAIRSGAPVMISDTKPSDQERKTEGKKKELTPFAVPERIEIPVMASLSVADTLPPLDDDEACERWKKAREMEQSKKDIQDLEELGKRLQNGKDDIKQG